MMCTLFDWFCNAFVVIIPCLREGTWSVLNVYCFTSRLAWRGHTSKMGWFESLNPLTPGCRLITAETHGVRTFIYSLTMEIPFITTRRQQCADRVYVCVTLDRSGYYYEFPKINWFGQKLLINFLNVKEQHSTIVHLESCVPLVSPPAEKTKRDTQVQRGKVKITDPTFSHTCYGSSDDM